MQNSVVTGTRARRGRDETPDRQMPEWQRRWHELQAARAELARWRTTAQQVEAAFQRDIAPRERRLTATLAGLTARLMEHVADDALDALRRSLLCHWILENLGTLAEHPFADQQHVDSLQARWRSIIAPDADSRAQPANRYSGAASSSQPGDECGDSCDKTSGDKPGSKPRESDTADHDASDGEPDLAGRPRPRTADAAQVASTHDIDIRALTTPLFRRLAQALHPDREPDEARRKIKQALMREALDARARGDVDTLLALHRQHIDDSADVIDGIDNKTLLKAIEQQMEVVQRSLRVVRHGNYLLRRIIERYGQDPELREQRVRRHALQLDQAIEELGTTRVQIDSATGLEHALQKRRDAEMDKQLIREMTGATA